MLRWRHGSQNLADAGCAAADDWEPGTPQPMRKTFKLMVCCFALSHVLVLALLQVYRTRFFGHKFELSGLLHSGFLPGDTCVVRTA
jgi:hypothetical protein